MDRAKGVDLSLLVVWFSIRNVLNTIYNSQPLPMWHSAEMTFSVYIKVMITDERDLGVHKLCTLQILQEKII